MSNSLKEKRDERKENNLCVQCGRVLDRQGIYCKRCNTRLNKLKLEHSHQQHKEGFCTQCGKPLDREGWYCKSCTETMRRNANTRYEERRTKGLCLQCGEIAETRSYCRLCLDKLKERRSRKTST